MPPPEASLDPELAVWLADPRVALRPPSAELPLEALRRGADGYLKRAPRPEVASVEDAVIAGPGGPLTLRVYRPDAAPGEAAIVFLHGGGFVFGDLETHDGLCRRLVRASGLTVVAVDYRLAPEHPYPAALDDGLAAVAWVRTTLGATRIGLAGDSAGAQVATAMALALAARGSPVAALGLLYPLADPDRAGASQRALGEGHMLTGAFLAWSWEAYRGGRDLSNDPLFDLRRADLSRLPPMTVVTAGYDPLRDEGLALAARAVEAGVRVSAWHYPDMIHGFLGLPGGSRRSDEAMVRLAEGLSGALRSG